MKKILLAILICSPLAPHSAFAEWGNFTGAEIVKHCKNIVNLKVGKDKTESEQIVYEQGVCAGYLFGIKMMLNRTDINYPKEFPKSCIPTNSGNTALVHAVINQANNLSHLLKYDAITLVTLAWSKEFPCK